MKKFLLIIATFILPFSVSAQAPDSLKTVADSVHVATPQVATTPPPQPPRVRKDTRPIMQRISFGLGTSFWITPNVTYAEISPTLAYRFPKTLITGLGYRYIYRRERVIGEDLNAYGPSIFARVQLFKRVYMWTEYEILHNQYFTNKVDPKKIEERSYTTTDSWFAGLGYIRSFGRKGRGGLSVQLLYNVLYKDDDVNPYYSPLTYRVGYFF